MQSAFLGAMVTDMNYKSKFPCSKLAYSLVERDEANIWVSKYKIIYGTFYTESLVP